MLPGLLAASRQTTDLAEPGDPVGQTLHRVRADAFADRLLQQRAPLREAPLERRGIAQLRHDPSQPVPIAGGTTEGQALLQHPDGVLQVPLGEVQVAEAAVGKDRCAPSACQRGEAERLLPMAPALGEGPEHAQGPRQPRLGLDPQLCPGRARLPVRRLHAPPQQLGCPAEVADGRVCLSQAMGCLHLQGALAERGRELEGLLARRYGAVEVSRDPVCLAYLGQHPSQPGPIVERPGQSLGLAQQGEVPPILSQDDERASQREAELEGQPPGVAVLGQVREGLEGLLEGGHRLAERGAVVGPGAGLLAVGHGLVPHLASQGMVRQAFDLVRVLPSGRKALRPRSHLGPPRGRQRLQGLDNTRMQEAPPLQQEAAVGHLVREGMLEGIDPLGDKARLVEELGRLQVGEAAVQYRLRQLGNALLTAARAPRCQAPPPCAAGVWPPGGGGRCVRPAPPGWSRAQGCRRPGRPAPARRAPTLPETTDSPPPGPAPAAPGARPSCSGGSTARTTVALSSWVSGGRVSCVAYDLSIQSGRYPGR